MTKPTASLQQFLDGIEIVWGSKTPEHAELVNALDAVRTAELIALDTASREQQQQQRKIEIVPGMMLSNGFVILRQVSDRRWLVVNPNDRGNKHYMSATQIRKQNPKSV